MPKDNKKPVRQPKDHGSNYNAFGHDPDGKIAYLAALFYGPGWVPRVTPKQFGGPPAPPRFGPPAPYQESCLPPGFKPRMHRNYYKMEAAFEEAKRVAPGEESEFLSPPKEFDPHVFDAFKFRRNFINQEDEETSVESNDDADDRLRVREVEELGGIMKGVDKVGAEERQ